MEDSMKVLVVNVGSTSLKFRLLEMPEETVLASGKIERVGAVRSPMSLRIGDAPPREEAVHCPDQRAAIGLALKILTEGTPPIIRSVRELAAVGFKPVHARGIADTVLIDESVVAAMEDYVMLAPAHNPPYIEAIRIFQDVAPRTPLVGVFEASFHRTIPDHARTYGIPAEWSEKYAIRRYGFHGASHRYVAWHVPELLGRDGQDLRVISCHLGGSSSICAIKGGESIDTSMGFSPQSGLPHATRNGDLDPFIGLYLMEQEGLTPRQLGESLATRGGLKGISGLSGDMRDLEDAAANGSAPADLAVRVLVYEIQKYIGAYFVALGGLDVLAFTGGIGENSSTIRERICKGLACLGIDLDVQRNGGRSVEGVISTVDSRVAVVVVAANEELVIARETERLLSRLPPRAPAG